MIIGNIPILARFVNWKIGNESWNLTNLFTCDKKKTRVFYTSIPSIKTWCFKNTQLFINTTWNGNLFQILYINVLVYIKVYVHKEKFSTCITYCLLINICTVLYHYLLQNMLLRWMSWSYRPTSTTDTRRYVRRRGRAPGPRTAPTSPGRAGVKLYAWFPGTGSAEGCKLSLSDCSLHHSVHCIRTQILRFTGTAMFL